MFFLYIVILFIFNSSDNIDMLKVTGFMFLLLYIPIVVGVKDKLGVNEFRNILERSSYIILSLFIVNVLLSSLFSYEGRVVEGEVQSGMYGFEDSFLKFGNLLYSEFNVVPIALTIIVLNNKHKSLIVWIICIVSFMFILISLRRSVIFCSSLPFIVYGMFKLKTHIFNFIKLFLVLVFGIWIFVSIGFADVMIVKFQHRFEGKDKSATDIESEPRYLEYYILYHDMFISNAYSPLYGYELFNSHGNYGNSLGFYLPRSLHSDLTAITHATGIIGLFLYLFIIGKIFFKIIQANFFKVHSFSLKFYIHFLVLVIFLLIFSFTGRITMISYSCLFFAYLVSFHKTQKFKFSIN